MSTSTLKSLVETLNNDCKQALEAATARCQSRSHYSVEIEHWLDALLQRDNTDFALLFRAFAVDTDKVHHQLQHALEQLKTGNNSLPGIAVQLISWLKATWLNTTIEFGDQQVRSAYLLYTLLQDESLAGLMLRRIPELDKINAAELLRVWPGLAAQSTEHGSVSAQGDAPLAGIATKPGKTPALDQFTIDLTAQARAGKIDPIVGRDFEIRQMIDILTRRRQNNPILTGEAGVGKTAVVEGLALRIAAADVPEKLKSVALRVLDLALLQAGAGMKGEFENRLKNVINEVKQSPTPIILFIDEAHTMIGSGGQAGQNDAANLLKPALARGELRTIAATTWAEYKKYFEKDAALTRRFQVVKVEEPSPAKAVLMMRGLLDVMERHHGVSITDNALQAAAYLSDRYISGRQLPDKAVGLLDTACARVAMSQDAIPGPVEDQKRKVDQLISEISVLQREQTLGEIHTSQLEELQLQLTQAQRSLSELQQQWQTQREWVCRARQLAAQLQQNATTITTDNPEPGNEPAVTNGPLLEELNALRASLAELTMPMVHWQVTGQLIAEVVADWTGIPLGKMHADEINNILALEQHLAERVVGQQHALQLIARTVQTSRAQLADENKPNGIFLLTGPSGVGKTETALAIAEQVYGSEDNLTVINMSEFKEEHKVSLLLGSPPGYVGYGEGGILTEAVRRKPYSVVLLDEMEKAHPGVQDIFYQVFDKGTIKDGEGRDIDFKNTIIIMTSNVGTDTTMRLFEDPETAPSIAGLTKALKDDLLQIFKPAFLGRVNVIPYLPLDDDKLALISALQLQRIEQRLQQHYSAAFSYEQAVVDAIVSRCQDAGSGARTIHNILQNTLLPELSVLILQRSAQQQIIQQVQLSFNGENFDYYID
ncbi:MULTISPECIES: type VI secretion system ATPase TssH [unclassified Arsukibacterium]|uniref:type VI secretion system ATPase TssH n=1 Tax=unclassified Arsukibacterium TaxID=2635278 RepID=UPI000C5C1E1E|nr:MULTISPECIES: type VI secretion system ATPase TssH [unclassified Arsukibacterium]MAA93546.1 type VI secretion system ATPase TssH [Rheinheimera sp.]MBM33490.1 type VI secretion system ATPase TssH [Rheinheimera sp.]|tara:strand:- start:10998 stop:13655 length:2658 start_codon:yes stop_codon:yes gene_type:complete